MKKLLLILLLSLGFIGITSAGEVPVYDCSNAPHGSIYPGTCWGDSAYQCSPQDSFYEQIQSLPSAGTSGEQGTPYIDGGKEAYELYIKLCNQPSDELEPVKIEGEQKTIDSREIVDNNIQKLKESNACQDCNLTGADLRGADLRRADLRGADLRRADLREAYLHGANLREADLHGADLSKANLSGANLREADLSKANLTGANLTKANLIGASLTGADLFSANIDQTDFTEANLEEAAFTGKELFHLAKQTKIYLVIALLAVLIFTIYVVKIKRFSFKEFALKPRKLANTFWLWGVLYPCLIFVMFFIIVFSAYMLNFYDSSGEIDFSIFIFFITLVTIEAFFALFLTFRASKSIGTCILQLLVLIFPILLWLLFIFLYEIGAFGYD